MVRAGKGKCTLCQFFSALITRAGDVLWHEATDSHSDLVRHFGLPDNSECRHFAKIEFTPAVADGIPDYTNLDAYRLKVDEPTAPAWWEEVAEVVRLKCRSIVSGMIVDNERDLLLGGRWILLDGAEVREARHAHVHAMMGGTLTAMMGGTLTAMMGGTLTAMMGGTLTAMRGGTLTAMMGGTLTAMRGGTLTTMRGGTLTAMMGGTLTEMRGGTIGKDFREKTAVIG